MLIHLVNLDLFHRTISFFDKYEEPTGTNRKATLLPDIPDEFQSWMKCALWIIEAIVSYQSKTCACQCKEVTIRIIKLAGCLSGKPSPFLPACAIHLLCECSDQETHAYIMSAMIGTLAVGNYRYVCLMPVWWSSTVTWGIIADTELYIMYTDYRAICIHWL